jgi:phosphate transport system permease protein
VTEFGSAESIRRNVHRRRQIGVVWKVTFYLATAVAVSALIILLLTIVDRAFGFVAVVNTIEPAQLTGPDRSLDELDRSELVSLLEGHLSRGLIRRFNAEQPLEERTAAELRTLVLERIVQPEIVESWNLFPSLFQSDMIRAYVAEKAPANTRLQFRAWLTADFLVRPQNPDAQLAGVRTALLGSMWMIALTLAVAFPLGVGAAIYLEEYARENWFVRIVQVNIYNLAGVPSIIYGLLGLAVFVRFLGPITSGAFLGEATTTDAIGRSVLSAGLTLGLLVLPIIIISSQEAIRAVPQSLRDSSYGLGATRWQTTWHHVLPAAFDRILTGTIIAVSRAVGETAPLILVGASTVIFTDPKSLFSQFTALPIQIYQWTARPQAEFRNVAAAAIIVLLVLLLSMNAFAIVTRDRIRRRRLI